MFGGCVLVVCFFNLIWVVFCFFIFLCAVFGFVGCSLMSLSCLFVCLIFVCLFVFSFCVVPLSQCFRLYFVGLRCVLLAFWLFCLGLFLLLSVVACVCCFRFFFYFKIL